MPSRADGRNGTGESSLWKKNKTFLKKIKTGPDSHFLDRDNVCQAFYFIVGVKKILKLCNTAPIW